MLRTLLKPLLHVEDPLEPHLAVDGGEPHSAASPPVAFPPAERLPSCVTTPWLPSCVTTPSTPAGAAALTPFPAHDATLHATPADVRR
jgi:hypothetical protein